MLVFIYCHCEWNCASIKGVGDRGLAPKTIRLNSPFQDHTHSDFQRPPTKIANRIQKHSFRTTTSDRITWPTHSQQSNSAQQIKALIEPPQQHNKNSCSPKKSFRGAATKDLSRGSAFWNICYHHHVSDTPWHHVPHYSQHKKREFRTFCLRITSPSRIADLVEIWGGKRWGGPRVEGEWNGGPLGAWGSEEEKHEGFDHFFWEGGTCYFFNIYST